MDPGSDDLTVDDTIAEQRGRAPKLSLSGYALGEVLGKGGMGEVLLASDRWIGRDVAIKRMTSGEPTPEEVSRFLREAKIQARLEHPAIVPVHQIGHDTDGRPYFTMKRLTGTTLQAVLRTESQQRMLRVLVDVCLAIEFAHSCGVVHRDLKPSNIMLGNFGEVYVLDWGVARVLADSEASANAIAPVSGETEAGAVLGTLGYMAPEQLRDATQAGPKADVYSIGCILFEILARGEHLHPRGLVALTTTLVAAVAPSQRHPEQAIAPELDDACLAALALAPDDRPTARELADRIQRFLDGDRDLDHRKRLSADCVAEARAAAIDPAQRAKAMRAVARAVGLDPSPEALGLATKLLLEPPVEHPPELAERLVEIDRAVARRSARAAAGMLLTYFAVIPVFAWAGVTSWAWVLGLGAYIAVCSLTAYWQSRTGRTNDVVNLILTAGICIGTTRFLGPFAYAPAVICVTMMGIGQQAEMVRRSPFVLVGIGIATYIAPFVLEAVGVLGQTVVVEQDRVTLTSEVVHLGGLGTYALVIIPTVSTIIVTGLFARWLAASRRSAERDLEIRAWHLQHLLPAE